MATVTINNGVGLGDNIDSLPVDKNELSGSETQIVDVLFSKKQTMFEKLLLGTKDVLVIGFLYILLSVPYVDTVIQKQFPSTSTSPYLLVGFKALLIMFLFFLIKNLYLVRKKN
jgi:hypothetical protein